MRTILMLPLIAAAGCSGSPYDGTYHYINDLLSYTCTDDSEQDYDYSYALAGTFDVFTTSTGALVIDFGGETLTGSRADDTFEVSKSTTVTDTSCGTYTSWGTVTFSGEFTPDKGIEGTLQTVEGESIAGCDGYDDVSVACTSEEAISAVLITPVQDRHLADTPDD